MNNRLSNDRQRYDSRIAHWPVIRSVSVSLNRNASLDAERENIETAGASSCLPRKAFLRLFSAPIYSDVIESPEVSKLVCQVPLHLDVGCLDQTNYHCHSPPLSPLWLSIAVHTRRLFILLCDQRSSRKFACRLVRLYVGSILKLTGSAAFPRYFYHFAYSTRHRVDDPLLSCFSLFLHQSFNPWNICAIMKRISDVQCTDEFYYSRGRRPRRQHALLHTHRRCEMIVVTPLIRQFTYFLV